MLLASFRLPIIELSFYIRAIDSFIHCIDIRFILREHETRDIDSR